MGSKQEADYLEEEFGAKDLELHTDESNSVC